MPFLNRIKRPNSYWLSNDANIKNNDENIAFLFFVIAMLFGAENNKFYVNTWSTVVAICLAGSDIR